MIKFCSLYSGSSGNSLFLTDGKTKLLIDVGLSAKKICEALRAIEENPEDIDAILISHEHIDHTRGIRVLSKKFNIPIFANEKTWSAIKLPCEDVKIKECFETNKEFKINSIFVNPFLIPHDAAEPVGFNFYLSDNKKVTTMTDVGHMTKGLLNYLENSNFVFLESNHDEEMLKMGKYPWHLKQRILGKVGHLSNDLAGKVVTYLAERGTKKFLLGHLSKENNFPQLAYQTVSNILKQKGIEIDKDIFLDIALRDKVGEVVEV